MMASESEDFYLAIAEFRFFTGLASIEINI